MGQECLDRLALAVGGNTLAPLVCSYSLDEWVSVNVPVAVSLSAVAHLLQVSRGRCRVRGALSGPCSGQVEGPLAGQRQVLEGCAGREQVRVTSWGRAARPSTRQRTSQRCCLGLCLRLAVGPLLIQHTSLQRVHAMARVHGTGLGISGVGTCSKHWPDSR